MGNAYRKAMQTNPESDNTVAPIPQSEPLDSRQVLNNAGGYTYQITLLKQLERFLILGTLGGTYYVGEREMTDKAIKMVAECLEHHGLEAIEMVRDVSINGRAHKQEPVLALLAMALSCGNLAVMKQAEQHFNEIVRTGTHLLTMIGMLKGRRGFGKLLARTITRWYARGTAGGDLNVAYQVAKYWNRGEWTHWDVLRVVHPAPQTELEKKIFAWIKARGTNESYVPDSDMGLIYTKHIMDTAPDTQTILNQIASGDRVVWEVIPSTKMTPEIWEVLIPSMPLMALTRNLGQLSAQEVIAPGKFDIIKTIVDKLTDETAIMKAKVHPMHFLLAATTYQAGKGVKGKLKWTLVPQIKDALDVAFIKAFKNVAPTGLRYYLALDVSGSMGASMINGTHLSARVASAAMALVTMQKEAHFVVRGFGIDAAASQSHDWSRSKMVDVSVSSHMELMAIVKAIELIPMGRTDCALPMLNAIENNLQVDVFVIYTDNETWAGSIHPMEALRRYRAKTGINAKLIVVGMTATEFSVADPADPNTLDVVGFDAQTPAIINEFSAGRI